MSLARSMVSKVRRAPSRTRSAEMTVADTLKSLVERQDSMTERSRVSDGYVHVSSLLNFCPRKWRLVQMSNAELSNFPKSADRVMWMIGRAAEHHVRTSIMKSLDWGGIYGRWSCVCGKHSYEGFCKSTATCNSCSDLTRTYGELSVFDEELKVVGNPDMLLSVEKNLRVVEIKSMNKREFDSMSAPKPNHVFQAACYHRILSSRFEMSPLVTIFYVCKDYSFAGSPYQEFSVPADDVRPLVDLAFEQVRLLREAEENNTLPDRLEACASPHTATAKKCEMCVQCFSR